MSLRGLFAGVVGLAFLEKVLSDQAAAGRVGGMLTAVGAVIRRLLDPSIPLVPDLRVGATSSSGGGAPSTPAPNAPHQGTTTTGPGRAVPQP